MVAVINDGYADYVEDVMATGGCVCDLAIYSNVAQGRVDPLYDLPQEGSGSDRGSVNGYPIDRALQRVSRPLCRPPSPAMPCSRRSVLAV
jgi:hypothetical protein